MAMKDGGVQVGGLGSQPGPQERQGGAQVQQPHFIRMYRDTFSAAQCEEVIRRFEADERKHASTTATRDKPRLRSGTGPRPPAWGEARRLTQALDGHDVVAFVHDGEGEAAVDPPAVDQHGAGAALSMIAAFLGAGQVQVLAQRVEQRGAGIQIEVAHGTVDGQRHGHGGSVK